MSAGRYPEALELAARIIEFDPGFPRGHSIWGWAQIKMGHDVQGLAALERAVGLDPDGTFFQAQLGQAMDWLERAYEQRAGPVYGIKGSFLFRSLRTHPRFTALLKKMNLA